MNILNYTLGISLSLKIMIMIEGIISMGSFFEFEKYTIFNWFVQILAVIITVCVGIKITHESIDY